ncbi:MAG: hypothetical protein H6608_05125 [Flavobacteriales bacterium]|nr:hypothetical protein [Bacteroidota bacterium]MCB9240486.1 hypothetical protein [Flavobacteriales bacterium]
MKTEENFIDFTFTDILSFLFRWRKHLLIITLASGIIAGAASYLITPMYEAEVVFYPTTINSIGNAMFTDLNKREADVLAFGEEEEAENALQVLKSDRVTQRIIQNFDLMNHYDIDPNGPYPYTKLSRKMKKNINFNRTRYLSISITVLDKDPQMAANIANGIGAIYDTVKTEIQKQVAMDAFKIVEEEYQNKEKEVWDLKMGLQELGKKGILDIEKQAQSISESLYALKASNNSNQAKVRELEAEKDTLAKYGSEYTNLYETLILELEELSMLRKRYKKAKVDVEKTIPQKFILTNAGPPEQKAKPLRKLIVAFAMLGAFFMAALVLVILEQRKKFTAAK